MSTKFAIKLCADLPGHLDRAWHATWSPTSPLIASCSADKTVRLYGVTRSDSGDILCPLNAIIPTGHIRSVRSIAWNPSGQSFATASFDSTIGIWERSENATSLGDWECTTTLEGHENECKSVAYSASGTLLASCSRDKSVWIWEVQPDGEFECLSVLIEHSQDVKSVVWHPEEELLASASYDNSIKVYMDDPSDDWYTTTTLLGHNSSVWSISFSQCGNYLASASSDSTVRLWSRSAAGHSSAGHKRIGWIEAGVIEVHDGAVYSVSWSVISLAAPSGLLASVGADGSINVWKVLEHSQPELVSSIQDAHGDAEINSVDWCRQERFENLLVTSADDGSVKIWSVGGDI